MNAWKHKGFKIGGCMFYIGIDSGGTKTTIKIVDVEGTVVSKTVGPTVHIANLGVKKSLSLLAKQLEKCQFNDYKNSILVMGAAGLNTQDDIASLKSEIKDLPKSHPLSQVKKKIFVNDAYIGLQSCGFTSKGICIISGTGANVYGLAHSGKDYRAGDWGYIAGDQGSGFALGQKILRHAVKEFDGREELTGLTDVVLEKLQVQGFAQLLSLIYKNDTVPVTTIASLTSLCEKKGNFKKVLRRFQKETVKELSSAFEAVHRTLKLPARFPVVLIGGVFENEYVLKGMTTWINTNYPFAKICQERNVSVVGAINLAQQVHNNKDQTLPELSLQL